MRHVILSRSMEPRILWKSRMPPLFGAISLGARLLNYQTVLEIGEEL